MNPEQVIHCEFEIDTATIARFWQKVKMPNTNQNVEKECWEWIGGKTGEGYGQFGLNRVMTGAHKISYVLEHGQIEEGLGVLHKCNNRSCVNPHHLYTGTAKDNGYDLQKRIESGDLSINQGENHPRSKLSRNDILSIRRLIKSKVPPKEISALFGISKCHVYSIKNRRAWSHI